MPKVKKTKKEIVSRLLFELNVGNKVFRPHLDGVFCKVCGCVLKSITKWTLTEHLATPKHKTNSRGGILQTSVNSNDTNTSEKEFRFCHELVRAFISADIPLNKLDHPELKSFIESYTSLKVPSVFTARTKYMNTIYDAKVSEITEKLSGKKIWVRLFRL